MPSTASLLLQNMPSVRADLPASDAEHGLPSMPSDSPERFLHDQVVAAVHAEPKPARPGPCVMITKLVLTPPAYGTAAILANLVGSKILGAQHSGFTFYGGHIMVNYLLGGMALSPAQLAARELNERLGASIEGLYTRSAVCTMVALGLHVGLGAATGATAAAIAAARHQVAQDPAHSAAANATGAIVIAGADLALGTLWRLGRRWTRPAH